MAVVHSPPAAKQSTSVPLVILVAISVLAVAILYLRPPILTQWPLSISLPAPQEAGRLIVKDDFTEPHFDLPIRSNGESELGYVGDLYQVQDTQPGSRVWATLNLPDLREYRVEADLRLGSQEQFAWGYGVLIVRYQNDENSYLFVTEGEGQYMIEVVEEGAWRTVRPWVKSNALSTARKDVLSVADDGAELRMSVDSVQVDKVAEPGLAAGVVGLVVGARPQAQARGLFDWVALYEIPHAR